MKPWLGLIGLVISILQAQAFALTGELVPIDQIIPQICMVRFVSGEICSGSIVGKRAVALADHCGTMINKTSGARTIGRVQCRGEKKGRSFEFKKVENIPGSFVTSMTGEKFEGDQIPRATDTSGVESSRYDVAMIFVDNEFETEPLNIANPKQTQKILKELWKPGACRIFGVGLNEYGSFGAAHGVDAPIYRGAADVYNPVLLEGSVGVAPMDSGGPLVCTVDNKPTLVGVASRGNGEVVSTTVEHLRDRKATSYFAYVGDPVVSAWLTSVVSERIQKSELR